MKKRPNKLKYSWLIEATMDMIGGKCKALIIYNLKDGKL
jgi:DNA-binding HxlR family transcriptional regulator